MRKEVSMNMCLIPIGYRDRELFGSTDTKGLLIGIERTITYSQLYFNFNLIFKRQISYTY
jgi:hypothetical protein